MKRIAWKETLSIGVPEVDDQHRHLFGLINDLFESMSRGEGEQAARTVFEELTEYTRYHFEAEEALMREAGYPELAAHHGEHERLKAEVAEKRQDILAGSYSESAVKLFLKTWLVEHILGWDFQIVEFLRSAPAARSTPPAPAGADFGGLLLDAMSDGAYVVDRRGVVTFWNKAAERITGYSAQEVMGRDCSGDEAQRQDAQGLGLCLYGSPLAAVVKDGVGREALLSVRHKNGPRIPVFMRGTAILGEDGGVTGAMGVFSLNDKLVQSRELIRQAEDRALLDPLTDLGNPAFAGMALANHLREQARRKMPFGLLLLQMDDLAGLRESWGGEAADAALRTTARSLISGVRPLDVVCRWDEDQFIAILPGVDAAGLATVAERLRLLVAHNGLDHGATATLAGVLSDLKDTAATLLDRAHEDLAACRAEGRNRTCVPDDFPDA